MVTLPCLSVLVETFLANNVKSGSKVASCLDSNSPILNPPANARVATAQIRRLSCPLRCELDIAFLNISIVLMVIGSLPAGFSLRFSIPSLLLIPSSTSFTNPVRMIGASKLLTMCSCLIPARYELTVAPLNFLILTSQCTKMSVFLSLNGSDKSDLVSVSHLASIALAVL